MHFHAIHVRSVAYVSSKKSQDPGSRKWSDWATLQASEAWKWSKRFGTSYLSLSLFLHKGWGFNLSSNKRCGTSLLQGFLTLNLGNPHSTMVVWLWILSVSNYCTRISPSCDVMIHPWKYGLSETCHIQDCRPSTAHIEGHNQQWLLPNQWTTSGRNWIWKTSDQITRADTGQPGNGEQWQRVSNTLISTASSQCITISSQKDHNVIMCHCSYFFPLNIQGTSTRHCTQFMLCSWIVSARPKFVVLHISPGSKSICLDDTLKETCFHRHTRRKMIEAIWYLYSC